MRAGPAGRGAAGLSSFTRRQPAGRRAPFIVNRPIRAPSKPTISRPYHRRDSHVVRPADQGHGAGFAEIPCRLHFTTKGVSL
jgi:hypothetical protein